jgi:hypothetical protein
MNKEQSEEMNKFDETMDRLLAVPYSELKKRLDEEKETKKVKKRGNRSISDARVSQKSK